MSDSYIPSSRLGSAHAPIPPAAADAGVEHNRQPSWAARAVWGVLLLGLLAAYAVILGSWFVPAIQHPDANGYWAQATRILQTGRSTFVPESDAQYIGTHWLLAPGGRYISRYPPGLPVAGAVLSSVLGPGRALPIDPALAVLTVAGVYVLTMGLLPGVRSRRLWSLTAAGLVATNTAFVAHAFLSISHMAVTCCLVWGLVLLLRWGRTGRIGWAFAAGLVLGCIPTIRYPDAVVAVGVGTFLLLTAWRFDRPWRHLLAAVGGAAVPIVPLLIRNQIALGAFWRTGYSLTNEQTGFSLENFRTHWVDYLQMLQGGGLGLAFGLGLLGLVWMLLTPGHRRQAMLLGFAGMPLLLLYMAYYWAMGVGINAGVGGMRFLVPLIPIAAVATAWMMATATDSAPPSVRMVLASALVAAQLVVFGGETRRQLLENLDLKRPLAMATEQLNRTATAGDVVIGYPGLLQHLDSVGRWKLVDPSILSGGGGMWMMSGPDPDSPSPMQAAKRDARALLYPGNTTVRTQKYLDDIQKYAAGHDIWLVASENDYRSVVPGVTEEQIEVVARIDTPDPVTPEATVGPFGPRRGQRGNWRGPAWGAGGGPQPPGPLADGPPTPPGGAADPRSPGIPGGGAGAGPDPNVAPGQPGAGGAGGQWGGGRWSNRGNARNPAANMRGGGGPFGRGLVAGQPIVIARIRLQSPAVVDPASAAPSAGGMETAAPPAAAGR